MISVETKRLTMRLVNEGKSCGLTGWLVAKQVRNSSVSSIFLALVHLFAALAYVLSRLLIPL